MYPYVEGVIWFDGGWSVSYSRTFAQSKHPKRPTEQTLPYHTLNAHFCRQYLCHSPISFEAKDFRIMFRGFSQVRCANVSYYQKSQGFGKDSNLGYNIDLELQ